MFRKVALFVGLCLCLSTPAMSADAPYLGFNIGFTMPSDSDLSEPGFSDAELTFDTGMAISATVGQKIGMGRLEAELGYKTSDLDSVSVPGFGSATVNGDASVLSLMGNGYIDFAANPMITPYVMAGLGIASLSIDSADLDVDDDDTVIAYQVGVGCGFALNKKVTLDVGYRYMGTTDADIQGVDVTYGSHNLLAGLRFNF